MDYGQAGRRHATGELPSSSQTNRYKRTYNCHQLIFIRPTLSCLALLHSHSALPQQQINVTDTARLIRGPSSPGTAQRGRVIGRDVRLDNQLGDANNSRRPRRPRRDLTARDKTRGRRPAGRTDGERRRGADNYSVGIARGKSPTRLWQCHMQRRQAGAGGHVMMSTLHAQPAMTSDHCVCVRACVCAQHFTRRSLTVDEENNNASEQFYLNNLSSSYC